MTDAKDLSKIDFSKCELPEFTARSFCDEIHIIAASGEVSANRRIDRGWAIANRRHSESLLVLAEQCVKVDSFITSELARIAAEEEAKNFVPVPWQDVEWLIGAGSKVQWRSQCEWSADVKWIDCAKDATVHPEPSSYRADRITFPAGYDPEKPRWVEVPASDVMRLTESGASVDVQCPSNGAWCPMDGNRSGGFDTLRYRVDIHTIPPGVPLHVEPEKPEPDWAPIAHTEVERLQRAGAKVRFKFPATPSCDWTVREPRDFSGVRPICEYQVNRNTVPVGVSIEPEKPEPKWRDCSREFALSHPETSQARITYNGWLGVSGLTSCSLGNMIDVAREFRTISPEPKPEPIRHTPDVFMRRLIDCAGTPIFAKTPRSPFATGRWFLFETSAGFKSGVVKDACTVNLDMHLFFAQEWFEVEQ